MNNFSGALFSDVDIKQALGKDIFIDPLDESLIRPSSIKLRLGKTFKFMKPDQGEIDTRSSDTSKWFEEVVLKDDEALTLLPKAFVLASTYEKVGLNKNLTGLLNTDSTLARIGLTTHGSSSLVPSGLGEKDKVYLTFELFNFGTAPIILYVGMAVCHLSFIKTITPSNVSHETTRTFHKGTSAEPTNFGKR